MQKVFLHLGAHKCASTTLQHNLAANRQHLEAAGLVYVPPGEIAKSPLGSHFMKLANGGFANEALGLKSARAARRTLLERAAAAPGRDLLLSWEGFLGHSALDRHGGLYPHIDQVAAALSLVLEGFDLRLLLVVRRQDTLIESCYLQQVKEMRALSFADFAAAIDPGRLSWLPVAARLRECCGADRLSLVPFERIVHRGGPDFVAECLARLTGRADLTAGFVWTDKANAGLSGLGVDLALQALPFFETDTARKDFIRLLFTHFSSDRLGRKTFLDPFTRRLIGRLCLSDNLALFGQFMPGDLEARDETDQRLLADWLG